MGRYFKTASPQNIDYMYKLPEKYLLAAVTSASEDITRNQAALYDLYGKLQLNALPQDKARAKQILDKYETSINDIASTLQENPLDFRRMGGDILGVSRELQRDFSRGEAAAIQSNYDVDAKWQKDYEEAVRKGNLENASWIGALRNRNLSRYTGVQFNQNTGNYNQYSPEELVKYQDVGKMVSDEAAKIKEKITSYSQAGIDANDDRFIREFGYTIKEITPERVWEVAHNRVMQNSAAQEYLKQGSEIGKLQGVYSLDEYGNASDLINPFVYRTVKDKNGKDVTVVGLNPQSSLADYYAMAEAEVAVRDVTNSYNRLKNIPKGSAGSRLNTPKGTLGGKLAGIQSFSSVNDINPVTTGAYRDQLITNIDAQDNTTTHKAMLAQTWTNTSRALAAIGDDELITELGGAIQKGDTEEVIKILDREKINAAKNGITEDLFFGNDLYNTVASINTMKDKAKNDATFLNVMDNLSTITGESVDKLLANPAFTDFTSPVYTHHGEWYDINPRDAETFREELRNQNLQFDTYHEAGNDIIVWQHDGNVVKSFSREDFDTEYSVSETSRRGGSSNAPANSRGRYVPPMSSSLNPISQLEEKDMARVRGTIVTDKGVELKDPFIKTFETKDGKKVDILYPREAISSVILNDIDSRYSKKREADDKVEELNVRNHAVQEIVNHYDVTKSNPEFKQGTYVIGKEIKYIPALRNNQMGSFILEGVKDPVNEDADILPFYNMY